MPEEPVSRARSIAQVATVRDAMARSPEPWAPHPRSWTPADALPRPRNQAFSEQQQSTATTALSNAFGFIQMRPGERKQGNKRLLRGVHTEEVTGSNPVSPTTKALDLSVRNAAGRRSHHRRPAGRG